MGLLVSKEFAYFLLHRPKARITGAVRNCPSVPTRPAAKIIPNGSRQKITEHTSPKKLDISV